MAGNELPSSAPADPAALIAGLRDAGRQPVLPCTVQLADGRPVLLCELLRLVPGKRLVGRGEFAGRPALVKLFIAAAHQRHGRRELAGVEALRAAGVRTPELLAAGPVAGGAYAVISEFLAGAESLGEVWQAQGENRRGQQLLCAAMPLLARMHAAGLAQVDLHPGNFLWANDALHAIDGDAVVAQKPARALNQEEVIANLAILFAGLTPNWDALRAPWLAAYQAEPGALPVPADALQEAVLRTRARRLEKFLDKTGRDCTQFAVERRWDRVWAAERVWVDQLRSFLAAPDAFVAGGHCLKDGGTCTVAASEIGGRTLLVKRYNLKHWRHALSRVWRPSRAWHSWRAAHRLRFYGIATPQPLAVLEERRGPLRGRAFLVTEFCPGANLLDTLDPDREPPADLAQALLTLFQQMFALRISHGDCKGTNLFWHAGEIVLIDLDALCEHRSPRTFKRAWRRDRARFLRNWPAGSVLTRWFDARLPQL